MPSPPLRGRPSPRVGVVALGQPPPLAGWSWVLDCGLATGGCPLRATLAVAYSHMVAPAGGLPISGCPFLAAFAIKTHIERVEQLYAIQSHHT
ncbi:hypothetical protein BHE74_00049939 [Ensete ventricosum]|nr:hypothetical protein BHE74_00049939 [Ensete ventricosum]RZS17265.1 hypothetical protein BHM03_00049389 [Ensete ventricosum]